MTTADQCVAQVTSPDGWRRSQCSRKGGHGPGGAYCKQHDPEAIAAKNAARDAKWRAEWDAADIARDNAKARDKFAAACIAYVRDIAAMPHGEDARRIVAEYEGKLK